MFAGWQTFYQMTGEAAATLTGLLFIVASLTSGRQNPMHERGVMLFTGATAGVKAGPMSVAFGPAKFAVRGLAQSLARDLGPRGIHVAYVNVDGIIDIPHIRSRMPSLKDEGSDLVFCLRASSTAPVHWHSGSNASTLWNRLASGSIATTTRASIKSRSTVR